MITALSRFEYIGTGIYCRGLVLFLDVPELRNAVHEITGRFPPGSIRACGRRFIAALRDGGVTLLIVARLRGIPHKPQL